MSSRHGHWRRQDGLARRRTLTLLLALCLGHVLLISAQVQASPGESVFRSAAFGLMAGVQRAAGWLTGGLGRFWSGYVWLVGASRDNQVLRERVVALEGALQAERALASRAAALEAALRLQQTVADPTLAARVIAGNPRPGALFITIDRGRADGVMSNMAVIAAEGVVGRVVGEPAAHAALVQLLIERSASAGIVLERVQQAAVTVGGFADGNLRLELVPSAADVTVGDRVVTSGQDGIYRPGFLIGRVSRIEGAGETREIVVTPAVRFSHLQIVLVVLARPAQGLELPR